MRKTVLALVIAALLAVSLGAQQTAIVKRNVNLRLDSSSDQPPIETLKPPAKLTLLNPEPEDGYYFVRTEFGHEGWVWGRNIEISAAAPAATTTGAASEISADWDKPAPNKSQFTGTSGKCDYDRDGDEHESNWRKNQTDIPDSYHDVTFAAIATLAYPVGPKNRSKWPETLLAEIRPFEGVAVRTVGYLAAVKPQAGSGESTNCYFTLSAETDWHVALLEKAGMGEKDAVVIETTPRIRRDHPKWTKGRLAPWTDTSLPVRISGWLFFDTEHRNHLDKYRSTLWEIHPITRFEVLRGGNWTDLDDVPN